VSDLADFDRYCAERAITAEEEPAAFAAWMHKQTGWDGGMRRLCGMEYPERGICILDFEHDGQHGWEA
jgi:hypothetical protein